MAMTTTAWRVANTRDEGPGGPLARALEAEGLVPVPCPVLRERAAPDAARLASAVARLADCAWLIVSSARSVRALQTAGLDRWPAGLRSAAVGTATAGALLDAGAAPAPLVGDGDGAEALWTVLRTETDWRGARVLVATTPGGRTTLPDRLRDAGAAVEVVEAYAMEARPAEAIRADWQRAAADAVVLTSARAATTLAAAVGADTLARLQAIVAVGASTVDALQGMGLDAHVAPQADLVATARVAATLARQAPRS
jgi:uroporphyrinogen-III synthase